LITTQPIAYEPASTLPAGEAPDLAGLKLADGTVADILDRTSTDSFLVLQRGKIVAENYPNMTPVARHILFSVRKSVTGTLNGILVVTA
jgi:CubicO group peptidase (beta-lactamase class C family)